MRVIVNAIELNDEGELKINLASTEANDNWLQSARLLKEGKKEEVKKLDKKPMYYDI